MSSPSWLYRNETIAWIHDPGIRRQLPWAMRVFALYCRAQRLVSRSQLLGRETLLRRLVRLSRILGAAEIARLDLGSRTIFLDLLDPRMLMVPNETARDGPEQRRLARWLRPGDTFVDIGANHGSFSVVAAEIVGASGLVVACEPRRRLAELVERSLAANAEAPFRVFAVACGERSGRAMLYVPRDSSGYAGLFASFSGGAGHDRAEVPLERFDELCDWRAFPGRLLVKLDIEGSESAFLAGATEMIRSRAPSLLMEISPASLRAAAVSGERLREQLRDLGYTSFLELDEIERRLPLSRLGTDRQRDVYLLSPNDG